MSHRFINQEKDKPTFPCPEKDCNATFTRKDNLARHLTAQHGNKGKQFRCPVQDCGKAFARKDALKEHMLTHETNRERSECGICHSTLASEKELKKHMKIHDPHGQVYPCPVCGQKIKIRQGLQGHCCIQACIPGYIHFLLKPHLLCSNTYDDQTIDY